MSRMDKHKSVIKKTQSHLKNILHVILSYKLSVKVKTICVSTYSTMNDYVRSIFARHEDEYESVERDPEKEWRHKAKVMNSADDWDALHQDTLTFSAQTYRMVETKNHSSAEEITMEDTMVFGAITQPLTVKDDMEETHDDNYLRAWNMRNELVNNKYNFEAREVQSPAHEVPVAAAVVTGFSDSLDTKPTTGYNKRQKHAKPVYQEEIPVYNEMPQNAEDGYAAYAATAHEQSLEDLYNTARMQQITEEDMQPPKKIRPVDPSQMNTQSYDQMKVNPYTSIHDVAEYFLSKAADVRDFIDSRHSVTYLKLNYLLYYVQSWHVVAFNRPLFNVNFEAFNFGVKTETICNAFDRYGARPLPRYTESMRLPVDEDCMQLIDDIWNLYGWCTEHELEQKIRNEDPWKHAFHESKDGIITLESMKDYYSKLVL